LEFRDLRSTYTNHTSPNTIVLCVACNVEKDGTEAENSGRAVESTKMPRDPFQTSENDDKIISPCMEFFSCFAAVVNCAKWFKPQ